MGRESAEISASSKLKKVAKKLLFLNCCSASTTVASGSSRGGTSFNSNVGPGQEAELGCCSPPKEALNYLSEMEVEEEYVPSVSSKNVCTICLEPLLNSSYTSSSSPGKAIFTSQCSHSFHLSCISSNIRHGSINCPVCRAQWTRLPRTLHPPCWLPRNQDDPIIRILDDSISTFRVHRRSFLRTARYNDDDPVSPEAAHSSCQPRLCFNLVPLDEHLMSTGSLSSPWYKRKRSAYLCVRLAPLQAIDLVVVATPNGPHLRLLKQSIAQVVFSLRAVDRLAIVSYSSAAARIFPLRRMTTYGKKAALQVIDRLFYAGHADPVEGLRKGIKILKDRTHENPFSSMLHLSDYPNGPTSSRYHSTINDIERSMPFPICVHQFHVAGSTNSIMHQLEEFLRRLLGGLIQEVQLRIGSSDHEEDGRIVRLGELRGDEERRVLIEVDDHACCIGYSYVEGGMSVIDERIRVGEVVVSIGDTDDGAEVATITDGPRSSCVDSWDYHDPYMARRWAKRLHERHRI
ncbi:hypothetical protein SOVF_047560 [Spinacia oleracea]|uniref:Probable E3 ubiquitin-protein ligase EDA40 n=1 Tax=Spinacia oleracea TaxID=3562 RepID=A0A9R0IWQ5_SPIOL|nr:probable E3 ubiquitin-protein ligase EDA40 [Spinacia oleracea]KNA20966.1 hypothetical protein SOVF_047560 [Spinacia oleracea]